MAFQQCAEGTCSFANDWLAHQAPKWIPHKILSRDGHADFVFAFHDREEIGPKMLARIARQTGLRPGDL